HNPQRVREVERADGDVGGILAKAVAGDERWNNPARSQQPLGRRADGENRGLRVLRQREEIVRTFEAEAAERLAERGVRFGKRVAADGKRIRQRFAHPDFLRALAWKEERDHRLCPAVWRRGACVGWTI